MTQGMPWLMKWKGRKAAGRPVPAMARGAGQGWRWERRGRRRTRAQEWERVQEMRVGEG